MFDLAKLSPSDVVVCGSDLRQAAARASTAEEAAVLVARQLRAVFLEPPVEAPESVPAAPAGSVPASGADATAAQPGSADSALHPAVPAPPTGLTGVGGADVLPRPVPGGTEGGGLAGSADAVVADSAGVAVAPGPLGATAPGSRPPSVLRASSWDAPAVSALAEPVFPPAPSAVLPTVFPPVAPSLGAGSFAGPVSHQVALARVYTTVREEAGTRALVLLAGDGGAPEPTHPGFPARIALSGPGAPQAVHPALAAVLDRLGVEACGGAGWEAERCAIAHIPDPHAAVHGVRTVVGFGGPLPDGEVFAVLLFCGVHVPVGAGEALRGLVPAARLALMPAPWAPVPSPRGTTGVVAVESGVTGATGVVDGFAAAARLDALEQLLAVAEDTTVEQARTVETYRGRVRTQAEQLRLKQRRLEQETQIVRTLYHVGQKLSRKLDLDELVLAATEAAVSVIAAEHGLLLYRDCGAEEGPDGDDTIRYASASRDEPGDGGVLHPLLPPAGLRLLPSHLLTDVVRSGDVADFPGVFAGEGHRAPWGSAYGGGVRSYLAVPVVSREGDVLGSFAFSHAKPDVFTERDEQLALGIAAQAAAAIENARLYRNVRDMAVRLQRSLLPPEVPDIDTLEIACRYLPGARGTQVGGDWFDVIPLSAGRVALVIGDVMGRGLGAAAVMGQLRTAVRAYAVMDLPPAQVMRHLNRLVAGMGAEDQITTCVYAVYDPGAGSMRWSNAGHLPPALVSAGGGVRLLDDDLGVPLGVAAASEGTAFDDAEVSFAASDRLLLYTDGLVERHDVSLTDRLGDFAAQMGGAARRVDGVQDTCDRLLGGMLTGREHDDVALLLVRAREGRDRVASVELPPTAKAAREGRAFVRSVMARWGVADRAAGAGLWVDAACSVATELVANAAEHARTPMELGLRLRPGCLVVQVADQDGRLPRRLAASVSEERHRGLAIVGALASDWGARPTDSGKVVWAELPEPGVRRAG
ncbi:SpoIIE family protein phosphatase [Uniformispora flossi]|uniref:ATP-binding SpoIIE family protein phosphatase n=1 Tax=Uniformispora flossi TaxID=3390723 RepID=UPI003C2E0002